MMDTPKSLRIRIGLFGKTNCGKSSIMNLITKQNISIVSDIEGTTTDYVEKNIELEPLGPFTFIDTPGINDTSNLGQLRINKAFDALKSCNFIFYIIDSFNLEEAELSFIRSIKKLNIPFLFIFNKEDLYDFESNKDLQIKKEAFLKENSTCIFLSAKRSFENFEKRELFLSKIKENIQKYLLENKTSVFNLEASPLQGLLPKKDDSNYIPIVLLVIPLDSQAPKGRLIMPQVQTIRDALDKNSIVIEVKTESYKQALNALNRSPDLVICDSQVVKEICEISSPKIKITTFSILFSRCKGDIKILAKGAKVLMNLQDNDKILIAEACSHHPSKEDIGRVKIPNWIREKYPNFNISIDYCSGHDFPSNLSEYKLVIHCGACMLNRREMLTRIQEVKKSNSAITNYGMAISILQGVLEPSLAAFKDEVESFFE